MNKIRMTLVIILLAIAGLYAMSDGVLNINNNQEPQEMLAFISQYIPVKNVFMGDWVMGSVWGTSELTFTEEDMCIVRMWDLVDIQPYKFNKTHVSIGSDTFTYRVINKGQIELIGADGKPTTMHKV